MKVLTEPLTPRKLKNVLDGEGHIRVVLSIPLHTLINSTYKELEYHVSNQILPSYEDIGNENEPYLVSIDYRVVGHVPAEGASAGCVLIRVDADVEVRGEWQWQPQ